KILITADGLFERLAGLIVSAVAQSVRSRLVPTRGHCRRLMRRGAQAAHDDPRNQSDREQSGDDDSDGETRTFEEIGECRQRAVMLGLARKLNSLCARVSQIALSERGLGFVKTCD